MNEGMEPFTSMDIEDFSCFSKRIDPSQFQILRVLGKGSFGKVFLVRKCTGPDNGTMFAMKVLKKASLKLRDRIRTKVERDILAAIRHPFIVRLEYAFQTEGKLYLILEYLRGGDLFSRLSKELVLPEPDARFYMAELALALNHIHQLGIIYRDLKPENILLDSEGHIKLTDFGLSKEAINSENGGRAFSFCGTIEYMAPEVITRRGHDAAADWWSLGVLMYEMLCGLLPFQGESRRDTMQQILRAKLRMPQFLSLEAQSLLRALFKRNPTNRLGYGPAGFRDLKKHQFFTQISWDKLLERSIPAPYIPVCHPDPAQEENDSCSSFVESPNISNNSANWETFSGFSYAATNSPPVYLTTVTKPENSHTTVESSDGPIVTRNGGSPREYSGLGKTTIHCTPFFQEVNDQSNTLLPKVPSDQTRHTQVDQTQASTDLNTTYKSLAQFTEDYETREVIRQTDQAVQRRCVHRRSFEVRAVKIIDRTHYDPKREIEILNRLRNVEHVVNLYDVYASEAFVYLVTEYAPGGRLRDRILRKGRLSEFEASGIVEILVKTIQEMQQYNINHGNLNTSNIVYYGLDQNPKSLLITDFGTTIFQRWSKRIIRSSEDLLKSPAPSYQPEIADDLYSLGLILHEMLMGSTPHIQVSSTSPHTHTKYSPDIKQRITKSVGRTVSADAQNLMQQLLTCDPSMRMTPSAVLSHNWIKHREDLPRHIHSIASCESLDPQSFEKLERFANIGSSPSVPILAPVLSSRLAARRQQTRGQSIPKTVILTPPVTYATINVSKVQSTSPTSCVSSVTLPRIHFTEPTRSRTPRSAEPWTSDFSQERYFSSTTFTLTNRRPACTSNQSGIILPRRVPV